MGLEVGDVGAPDLIGCRRLELLFQLVLSHDGRLAAISCGAPLVADMDNAGQRCQARNRSSEMLSP